MASALRDDVVLLAGVAGLILAVESHGGPVGLVAIPRWILLSSAALLVTAIVATHPKPRVIAAFVAGAAMGFALPSHIVPPPGGVLTHTVAFARGSDLFDVLQRLDDDPQSLIGTRISVSGLWRPAAGGSPPAVYRTIMACCLADAIAVGFDVSPSPRIDFKSGAPIRVTGIVEALDVAGETRYRLSRARIARVR